MTAFAAALLILSLPAYAAAQAPATRVIRTPAEPVSPPGSFAETLLRIEDLEQDTRFNDAIELCRRALETYALPAQQALLRRAAARLTRHRTKAHEVSFAIRSLADGKEHNLEEARETLRAAAEVSRLYLRKAAVANDPATVREAGSVLIEIGDNHIPGIFIERWKHHYQPHSSLTPVLLELIDRTKRDLNYDLLKELCDRSMARTEVLKIVVDSLEASVTLPPLQGGKEDDVPKPDLKLLATRMKRVNQLAIAQQLLTYVIKNAEPGEKEKPVLERAEDILAQANFPDVPKLLTAQLHSQRDPAVISRLVRILDRNPDHSLDTDAMRELLAHAAKGDATESLCVSIVLDVMEKRGPRLDKNTQTSALTLLVGFVEKHSAEEPKDDLKRTIDRSENALLNDAYPQVNHILVHRLRGSRKELVADRLVRLLRKMAHRIERQEVQQLGACTAEGNVNRSTAASVLMDWLERAASTPVHGGTPVFNTLSTRLEDPLQPQIVSWLVGFIARTSTLEDATEQEKKDIVRAEKILVESNFAQVPTTLVAKLSEKPQDAFADRLVIMLDAMRSRLDVLPSNYQQLLAAGIIGFVEARVGTQLKAEDRPSVEFAEKMLVETRLHGTEHLLVDKFTAQEKRKKLSPPFDEELVRLLLRMKDRLAALDSRRRGTMVKALLEFMGRREGPKAGKEQKAVVEQAEAILLEWGLPEVPKTLIASLQGAPSDKVANRLVRILERKKGDLVKADDGTKSALGKALLAYMEGRIGTKPKAEQKADLERAGKLLLDTRHPRTYSLVAARFSSGSRPSPELAVHLVRILDQVRTDLSRLDANKRAQLIRNLLHFMELWTRPNTPREQQDTIPLVDRVLQESKLPEALTSMVKVLKTAKSDPFADHLVMLLEAKRGSLSALDANTQSHLILGLLDFMEKRLAPNATSEQKRNADRAKAILVESKLAKVPGMLLGKLRREPAEPFTRKLVEMLKALRDQTDERMYTTIKSLAAKEGPNKPLLADLVNHLKSKFPDKK